MGILLTLNRKFLFFITIPPKRTPKKKEAS